MFSAGRLMLVAALAVDIKPSLLVGYGGTVGMLPKRMRQLYAFGRFTD
jgi:hypothetical protein